MDVIFLDFDGVINSKAFWKKHDGKILIDNPFDYKNVRELNRLTNLTDAKIVISSAWRKFDFGLDELIKKLRNAGVQGDIIGETPVLDVPVRGMEIQAWLIANPNCKKFVILDDVDDMGWLKDHLILIDGDVGLTKKDATDATHFLLTQEARGTIKDLK